MMLEMYAPFFCPFLNPMHVANGEVSTRSIDFSVHLIDKMQKKACLVQNERSMFRISSPLPRLSMDTLSKIKNARKVPSRPFTLPPYRCFGRGSHGASGWRMGMLRRVQPAGGTHPVGRFPADPRDPEGPSRPAPQGRETSAVPYQVPGFVAVCNTPPG